MSWVLFFQAEDGIRDLVRSRGLGDVYKRQQVDVVDFLVMIFGSKGMRADPERIFQEQVDGLGSVSYTHLTLPTSDLV